MLLKQITQQNLRLRIIPEQIDLKNLTQSLSNIPNIIQLLQKAAQLSQLRVISIIIKRNYWNSIANLISKRISCIIN